MSLQNRVGDGRVPRPVAALQVFRQGGGHPEIRRFQRAALHLAVADLKNQRAAGSRDFVQTVAAVNHETAAQSQNGQGSGDQFGGPGRRRSGQLGGGPGGIGERA
jgi:hypothetical protein